MVVQIFITLLKPEPFFLQYDWHSFEHQVRLSLSNFSSYLKEERSQYKKDRLAPDGRKSKYERETKNKMILYFMVAISYLFI